MRRRRAVLSARLRRNGVPVRRGGFAGILLVALCVAACDGTSAPAPPGGGHEVHLDYGVFVQDIEPILNGRGCSNSACHGGQGSGELLLSGGDSPESDFIAVSGLVTPWEASASALLLKPLAVAAGGVEHGGGDIFADTLDVDYRTILAWVEAGR
jgi:hypothetical protein